MRCRSTDRPRWKARYDSYFPSPFIHESLSPLNALQPTTFRRQDDPEYRDDPEFSRFSESLSEKLFSLTTNIGKLSQQISLLGTKRDTERVRERVHDLLEEARDGFKEVGEGVKKLSAWEDLSVRLMDTRSYGRPTLLWR